MFCMYMYHVFLSRNNWYNYEILGFNSLIGWIFVFWWIKFDTITHTAWVYQRELPWRFWRHCDTVLVLRIAFVFAQMKLRSWCILIFFNREQSWSSEFMVAYKERDLKEKFNYRCASFNITYLMKRYCFILF